MTALLWVGKNWRLLVGAMLLAYIAWLHVDRANLRTEVARLDAEMTAALRVADEDARNIEAEAKEAQAEARITHANEMAAADRRYRDALVRLRDAEARASLKPADTAPAECGSYAASPTQLPVRDAEFLVGLADRADRVVVQLRTCQRELRGVIDAVNSHEKQAEGRGDALDQHASADAALVVEGVEGLEEVETVAALRPREEVRSVDRSDEEVAQGALVDLVD